MYSIQTKQPRSEKGSRFRALFEVGLVSAKLGLTSFGGPTAHLGYFHEEYVRQRKWMDERSYADLVALCQFLPGPASSQVGIGIGILRAGLLGGMTAWLGFTLPSVIALTLFAFFLQGTDVGSSGWIHGLKIVAVAIVAHAILGMGQKLANDRTRATMAVAAAVVTLLWQTALSQMLLIAVAGLVGLWLYRKAENPAASDVTVPISRRLAVSCLVLFLGLLFVLPVLRQFSSNESLHMFDSLYRAGSLVFGGGHVVLPLLEREFVPTGWISPEDFLAGYGAAQAIPGPMFTFASYLGAMTGGLFGAIIATLAIFLPAFLLVVGTLPFWNALRNNPRVQGALMGINAAVVGILLAALYDPLWTSAIRTPADFSLASVLFVLLTFWKTSPWIIVLAGAAGGVLVQQI